MKKTWICLHHFISLHFLSQTLPLWHSPQKSHRTSAPPSPLRVSWRMTSSSAARPSSPPETWWRLREGTQYARYHQTEVNSANPPPTNLDVIKREKTRYVMFDLMDFVFKHSPNSACNTCHHVYHCVTREFLLTTLASILEVRMLNILSLESGILSWWKHDFSSSGLGVSTCI